MKRRDMLAGTGTTVLSGLLPWTATAQSSQEPKLIGFMRTNWSRDPFSFGTYSHIAKGSQRKDHRRLAEPVADKVYFAGEAANPDRNSSVHAALESGRLVASQIAASGHKRIGEPSQVIWFVPVAVGEHRDEQPFQPSVSQSRTIGTTG